MNVFSKSLRTLFLCALVGAGVAGAQETGETEGVDMTPEELGWTPSFRVVGFADRPGTGDCDAIDARYGRCIELVDIVDMDPPWVLADRWREIPKPKKAQLLYFHPSYFDHWSRSSQGEKKDERKYGMVQLHAFSELYAQLWEDMAYRWKEDEDENIKLLQSEGFKTLPTTSLMWDYRTHYKGKSIYLPERSSWMDAVHWFEPVLPVLPTGDPLIEVLANTAHVFPLVKYAVPSEHFVEPTPAVLLKGRFALRLGYNNRSHDYQLMDGDPKTSGPFFEQLYPYQTIYEVDDSALIPLSDFRYPQIEMIRDASKMKNMIPVDSLESAGLQAGLQFNRFYRLVATQVMQFSMQDYTINHMRILGSLTTMRTPPGSLAEATGIVRNLNAAAQGQTDSKDLQESQISREAYAVPGGFKLNYLKIPEILIIEWLERIEQAYPPPPSFYYDVTSESQAMFGDLLSSRQPTILEGVTDIKLKDWVSSNAGTGTELNVLLTPLRQLALERLMGTLEQAERDVEETWLLLDHVNYAIASNMDDTIGVKIAPKDLADLTAGKWETVLEEHFYATQRIAQGLGAIDPTAVCTSKDRREALAEQVVGATHVDLLFSGLDNKEDPGLTVDDLLWGARHQLPFLMIDNPGANVPKLERLVGLPSGEAIYRARWKIWSGWHLLWGVEAFAGSERLTLRTSAICEDLVMAHPNLAPSILRASLLQDEFFPTQHVHPVDTFGRDDYPGASERQKNKRKMRDKPKDPRTESRRGVLDEAARTKQKVDGGMEEVQDFKLKLESPAPTTAEDVDASADVDLGKRGLGLSFEKRQRSGRKPFNVETTVVVDYFHDVMRTPIEALSRDEDGLLLFVMDSTDPQSWSMLQDGISRTPYLRDQSFLGWNKSINTAGWVLYFDKDVESDAVYTMAPIRDPADTYAAGSPMPTWSRRKTTDVTFVGDVGMFPIRRSHYVCNPNVNEASLSSLQECQDDASIYADTEGFSFSFASFTTQWFRDDPRLAIEGGLNVHIDVLHGGKSWFYNDPYADVSILSALVNGEDPKRTYSASPSYSWSFRPQTGGMVGFRHALDPLPSQRLRSNTPWGADDMSGRSMLTRYEWGFRTGFLVGPGYNGMEGTLVADLWTAKSMRSPNSDWANFTPYHPIWNGGPFLRYQYGFMVVTDEDESRLYDLDKSNTLIVGWRTHFRFRDPRPE
jgi:hypothetical protein